MIIWPTKKKAGTNYVPANSKRGRQIMAQNSGKETITPIVNSPYNKVWFDECATIMPEVLATLATKKK